MTDAEFNRLVCERKRVFNSEEDAMARGKGYERHRKHKNLVPYKCSNCGKYHLTGNMKSKIEFREAKRSSE